MSRGYAKFIAAGNLTRDPELRTLEGGHVVCNFSIAVNEKRGDKETVGFYDCVIWDKFGEAMGKVLTKGRQVFIEARPRNRSWEKDGQKHQRIEFHVDELILGDGGERRDGRRTASEPQESSGGAYDFPTDREGGGGQQRSSGKFG
jgi:single-strand DNA-binding protein